MKVWYTTCGQTAVSFKGDFVLASPYMRTSFFWDVTRCRRQSGSRGFGAVYWTLYQRTKDSLTLEQVVDTLSRKVANLPLEFDTWRPEKDIFYFLNRWCKIGIWTFLHTVRQSINCLNSAILYCVCTFKSTVIHYVQNVLCRYQGR